MFEDYKKKKKNLESFDKNKKRNRMILFSVLGILFVVGVITLFKTFAFYKEEAAFNVIRGRVPNFVANDLKLAIVVDGQTQTRIPEDKKGYKVSITCDHDATGTWNYETGSITIDGFTEVTKCSVNFESIYTIYVNGEQVNAFPSQGNYETSMTCDKGSASWNKEEWQPNVSTFDPEMKCDVVFTGNDYLFTTIIVNGEEQTTLPEKGVYPIEFTCENGSGTWDRVNWKPVMSELNANTKCTIKFSSLYNEATLNGADPNLGDEMVPILIGNGGSVTYANPQTEWYNYANKNWANAVILLDGAKNKYKVGDTISESDIESYFVWIPKYAYKIQSLGTNTTNKPFEIKFGTANTTNSSSECIAPNVSGENGSCDVGKYMTHPAFTSFGDVKGLWVGKFETGYKGTAPSSSTEGNVNDSTKVQIKPNVNSWRYITNSNAFKTSYNYKRNLDSHMMKNTEWGAVAYLTHSIYGKCNGTTCEEVYINNNSNFITGWSGTSVSASGSTNDGYAYSHASSVKASSTGNYSGIYDLSGGAYDRVAGVRESLTSGSAGFTSSDVSTYNKKYYDTYSTSANSASTYTTRILGDATAETKGWNGDSALFVYSGNPWFVRGGGYNSTSSAGVFSFYYSGGGADSYFSFRVVLAY